LILSHGSDPSQVALTFDDGPSGWTVELLPILAKYNAKATFFVLGKWVAENPEILNIISRLGHEIGNHTENHFAAGSISEQQLEIEIESCSKRIQNATWQLPKLFRPPYGNNPDRATKTADIFGLKTVMWSQLSGDWAAKSAEDIFSKVNLDTDKGEIVLLHDGSPEKSADRSHTLKAVEMILQKWPNKKFVTVSELA